jgi:hypothetical protein
MLTHMFDEGEDPFPRYRNFFNVHRIDIASQESGADIPPQGIFRNTALGATYFGDGSTDRLLTVNTSLANAALSTNLAGAPFTSEMKLVTVNDTRYGGSGGTFSVYAGGNSFAPEVALHEIGHSFGRLADHYVYAGSGLYTGSEPVEPDVTKSSSGKWPQWMGYNQPVIGTIGAYEGGRYFEQGIYRPSLDSKMNSLGRPFDAVGREQLILRIYDYVNPLDNWRSNATTLTNPGQLWVDVVDPNVINVDWFVNGQLVVSNYGERFDPAQFGYSGSITVTALGIDRTDWVRTSLNSLQQSITWNVTIASAPQVQLSIDRSSLGERGGQATLRATLSHTTAQSVTVNLGFRGTATNNTDYTASGLNIVIPAGTLTGSINVNGINDATYEGNESITIDVTSVINGTENGSQSVTTTIVDDDTQPNVTLSLSGSPFAEDTGVSTVFATLSNPSTQPVTVNLGVGGTATNNADYYVSSLSIMIPAGSLTGALTLTGINDTAFEGGESIVVDVTSVTNGTENGVQQITATIVDDDAQPSVDLSLLGEVLFENGGTSTVIVQLTNLSVQDVTVSLGLSGTATQNVDYSASSVQVTVPAGQLSGSITIAAIDDALLEGQESVLFDVLSATNATENGSQSVVVAILDDESPNVSMSFIGSTFGENGGSTKVRVTLDRTASQAVLVDLAFSGIGQFGVDYSASSTSLAIQPGLLTAEITLLGLDDSIAEGAESITIDIDTVNPGQELGTQQVTANILDDATDSFQLIGDTLTITGTPTVDTLTIDYGSSTSSFTATINGGSATYSASTITFDGTGGNDTLTVRLSSLGDTATLNGRSGSITSSNYSISFSNVETAVMFGSAGDLATFNDPGTVNKFTFLAPYSIMQSTAAGYLNQTVGFGGSTGNGVGNNDSIFLYGDGGNQTLTASPTQVSMTVGTQPFVGNNIRSSYAYATLSGSTGNDSATYNGTTADEVLTSTPGYSIVSSAQTLQYFVGFKKVTANSGGGVDSAKMYDSSGNDTFTSSTTTARFFGATFDYQANGYTRIYAYQTRGIDTATLTGTAGNDTVVGSLANTSITAELGSVRVLQQVFNFSSVIVNVGAGNDSARLDDSTGNDTFNASRLFAELTYANGRKIRLNGLSSLADKVTARGTAGGVNQKIVTGTPPYGLNFVGSWL